MFFFVVSVFIISDISANGPQNDTIPEDSVFVRDLKQSNQTFIDTSVHKFKKTQIADTFQLMQQQIAKHNKERIKSEIENKKAYIIKKNTLALFIVLTAALLIIIFVLYHRYLKSKKKFGHEFSELKSIREGLIKEVKILSETHDFQKHENQKLNQLIENFKKVFRDNETEIIETNKCLKHFFNLMEQGIGFNNLPDIKVLSFSNSTKEFRDYKLLLKKQKDSFLIAYIQYKICTTVDAVLMYLTMLHLSSLISENIKYNTDELLNKLRMFLVKDLGESFYTMISRPIHIALLKIDYHQKQIQYSGANAGVSLLKGKTIEYMKPDEMSLGYSKRSGRRFSLKTFSYSTNDILLIVNDDFISVISDKLKAGLEDFLGDCFLQKPENVYKQLKNISYEKEVFFYAVKL